MLFQKYIPSFFQIISILLIAICLWMCSFSQAELVDFAVKTSGAEHLKSYIENAISQQKFIFIKAGLVSVIALLVLLMHLIQRHKEKLHDFIERTLLTIKNSISNTYYLFQTLSIHQKGSIAVIFCLFIAKSIFIFYNYELQYDDCWTYNRFISKGFFFSWAAPHNNHPLYSMLIASINWIPLDPKWLLRTPNFIIGVICLWVFFQFLFQKYGFSVAITGLIWLAFCPPFTYYVLYARGYMMSTFFFMLAFIYLQKFKNQYRGSTRFALASFLSVAASPGSLLLVAILFIDLFTTAFFHKTDKLLKSSRFMQKIRCALIFITLSAIFYFPSMILGGVGIANQAIESSSTNSMIAYCKNTYSWLFGFKKEWSTLYEYSVAIFVILVFGIVSFYQSIIQKNSSISTILMLGAILFCALFKIMPPERVWTPLVIPLSIVFGLFFQQKRTITVAFGCLFAVLANNFMIYQGDFMNWSRQLDIKCASKAEYIANMKVESIYLRSYYLQPRLEMEFIKKKKHIKLFMSVPNSLNFIEVDKGILMPLIVKDYDDSLHITTHNQLNKDEQFEIWVK
jgi:hypothetical protein